MSQTDELLASLSSTTIKGVWKFNETLTPFNTTSDISIDFTSNGHAFEGLYFSPDYPYPGLNLYYDGSGMDTPYYSADTGWIDEGFRTIDFGDTEQDFFSTSHYEWFMSNATQAVIDSEPHIVVNNDQSITVPAELKKIAIQNEHNVKTVTFDCPRYWDGRDLLTMEMDINFELSDKTFGKYEIEEIHIDPLDDSIIHFDWTIEKEVTVKAGPIKISLCAKNVDETTGEDLNHWNSEINEEMYISKGLDWDTDLDDDRRNYVSDLITRSENAVTLTEENTNFVADVKAEIDENLGDFDETLDVVLETQKQIIDGNAVNMALLAYPVGSVYMSVVDVDPGTIFGGTWEWLKDRFLLGAGDTYAAGATGGNATHNHTHDLWADICILSENSEHRSKGTILMKEKQHENFVYMDYVLQDNGALTRVALPLREETGAIAYKRATNVGGTIGSSSNLPPYLAVYMWKRVA